jgi:hypothetical protein
MKAASQPIEHATKLHVLLESDEAIDSRATDRAIDSRATDRATDKAVDRAVDKLASLWIERDKATDKASTSFQ